MSEALSDTTKLAGVFEALKTDFRFSGGRRLLDQVSAMNDFRNTRIAHQETPLTDAEEAKTALRAWVEGLAAVWAVSRG
jgi:type III restriction enzyme